MHRVNTEVTIESLVRKGLTPLISNILGILIYGRTEIGYIFSLESKELFLADENKAEWLFPSVFDEPHIVGINDNLMATQKYETV